MARKPHALANLITELGTQLDPENKLYKARGNWNDPLVNVKIPLPVAYKLIRMFYGDDAELKKNSGELQNITRLAILWSIYNSSQINKVTPEFKAKLTKVFQRVELLEA